MNIGDNILTQDVALFNKAESEEALSIMRYLLSKERYSEKRLIYLGFIDKLEVQLLAIYQNEAKGLNETHNHQVN